MTYTPPEQPSSTQPAGGYSGSYSPPAQGGYQPTNQYETPKSNNTSQKLSLWGLILSITGVVLPIGLNSIAGGVLSGIGLAQEPLGKVKAIWGLVLAGVGFIWMFIFWPLVSLIILAAIGSSVQSY